MILTTSATLSLTAPLDQLVYCPRHRCLIGVSNATTTATDADVKPAVFHRLHVPGIACDLAPRTNEHARSGWRDWTQVSLAVFRHGGADHRNEEVWVRACDGFSHPADVVGYMLGELDMDELDVGPGTLGEFERQQSCDGDLLAVSVRTGDVFVHSLLNQGRPALNCIGIGASETFMRETRADAPGTGARLYCHGVDASNILKFELGRLPRDDGNAGEFVRVLRASHYSVLDGRQQSVMEQADFPSELMAEDAVRCVLPDGVICFALSHAGVVRLYSAGFALLSVWEIPNATGHPIKLTFIEDDASETRLLAARTQDTLHFCRLPRLRWTRALHGVLVTPEFGAMVRGFLSALVAISMTGGEGAAAGETMGQPEGEAAEDREAMRAVVATWPVELSELVVERLWEMGMPEYYPDSTERL